MIHKITFLLHHKKDGSNHLFSKQLKNLQSNLLIVGFISIILFKFRKWVQVREGQKPQKQHALKVLPHTP